MKTHWLEGSGALIHQVSRSIEIIIIDLFVRFATLHGQYNNEDNDDDDIDDTDLNVNIQLFLLVTVDNSPILDDEPVLGALEVDGDLLDWCDHGVDDDDGWVPD